MKHKKGKKPLVLIVDDVPKNLQVLGNNLKELDCQIAVAMNGQQALDICRKTRPDLLLLDVMMPVLDGYETIKQLKADDDLKHIPVIFLTAKTEQEDILEGFNLGAVDYVTKPFQKAELLARISTQLKLKQQKDELLELNATKVKLFSIISHDLKNPFQSILGFSEILLRQTDRLEEDQLKFIQLMYSSGKNAYALLENLLEWSRLHSGTLKTEPKQLIVRTLVDQNLDLYDAPAKKKNIHLHSVLEGDLQVFGDENMISTVLRNLINNAVKFTPECKEISIRAERLPEQKEVKITISDQGIGIPASRIDTLFDVSSSKSTPGTANETGTGLGLVLCKDFIEQNNGRIIAESKEGEGSSFMLYLPEEGPVPGNNPPAL